MRNGSARLPGWWYARRRIYYHNTCRLATLLPRPQLPLDSSNPPPPSPLLLRLLPLSPRRLLRKYYLFVSPNRNSLPYHSLCPPTPLFYLLSILQCRRYGCTDSESIRVSGPRFYRPLRKIHQGQIPAVRGAGCGHLGGTDSKAQQRKKEMQQYQYFKQTIGELAIFFVFILFCFSFGFSFKNNSKPLPVLIIVLYR